MPFLLLALSPFVIFDSDYALILSPLCKSNTCWNRFMILGGNGEQDEMTCYIHYALISCQLGNLNALWNILIRLGRNVEQEKTMCHVQE